VKLSKFTDLFITHLNSSQHAKEKPERKANKGIFSFIKDGTGIERLKRASKHRNLSQPIDWIAVRGGGGGEGGGGDTQRGYLRDAIDMITNLPATDCTKKSYANFTALQ
jgi:hypothetical protein